MLTAEMAHELQIARIASAVGVVLGTIVIFRTYVLKKNRP